MALDTYQVRQGGLVYGVQLSPERAEELGLTGAKAARPQNKSVVPDDKAAPEDDLIGAPSGRRKPGPKPRGKGGSDGAVDSVSAVAE